jgi:hypothetical protein
MVTFLRYGGLGEEALSRRAGNQSPAAPGVQCKREGGRPQRAAAWTEAASEEGMGGAGWWGSEERVPKCGPKTRAIGWMGALEEEKQAHSTSPMTGILGLCSRM